MKIWVLFAFVVVLLLMGVRERFEATDKIKDPVTWDDAEYTRIRGMVFPISTATNTKIQDIVGGFFPRWKAATYRITMNEVTSYISSKNLSGAEKTEFTQMVKAYYIDQGQSVFEQAANYVSGFIGQDPTVELIEPTCPSGSTLHTSGMCKFDVKEASCPSPSTYVTNLSQSGAGTCMNAGRTFERVCPEGYTMDSYTPQSLRQRQSDGTFIAVQPKCRKADVGPTCPTTHMLTYDNPPKCRKIVTNPWEARADAGTTPSDTEEPAPAEEPGAAASGTTTTGATAGGTGGAATFDAGTGGSTSFYGQPNSGTAGRGKGLFGPAFTELGAGGDGRDMTDTSKTTRYPELLGGAVTPSTRIEGVGIVGPSKSWQLAQSGDLPTACSLGAEERSAFFPFSRCPGDKDLIPDPYRVSQTYSAASYGSKTEPVPFLTDFSAFLK